MRQRKTGVHLEWGHNYKTRVNIGWSKTGIRGLEWWMVAKLKVWQKCDYTSMQERAHCSLNPSCFPLLTLSEVQNKEDEPWWTGDHGHFVLMCVSWLRYFLRGCIGVTEVVQKSVLSFPALASLLAHIFQLHNPLRPASHWRPPSQPHWSEQLTQASRAHKDVAIPWHCSWVVIHAIRVFQTNFQNWKCTFCCGYCQCKHTHTQSYCFNRTVY